MQTLVLAPALTTGKIEHGIVPYAVLESSPKLFVARYSNTASPLKPSAGSNFRLVDCDMVNTRPTLAGTYEEPLW